MFDRRMARRRRVLAVSSSLGVSLLAYPATALPPWRAVRVADIGPDGALVVDSELGRIGYWPDFSVWGDGVRFRFDGLRSVVGTRRVTVDVPGSGTTLMPRAARWRCTGSSWSCVDFSSGAGSVVMDVNASGISVGATVVPDQSGFRLDAVAWLPDVSGNPGATEVHQVFGGASGLTCGLAHSHVASILTAVGQCDGSIAGIAQAAGVFAGVHQGIWCDGFTVGLPSTPAAIGCARFPGAGGADWCDSWENPPPPRRASFGQVVFTAVDGSSDPWTSQLVAGSFRLTMSQMSVNCVDSQFWGASIWSRTAPYPMVLACRGCAGVDGDGSAVESCAEYFADGTWVRSLNGLRFSSAAPASSGYARPLMLSGEIALREVPVASARNSNCCGLYHAAVMQIGGAPTGTFVPEVFDLHDIANVASQWPLGGTAISSISRASAPGFAGGTGLSPSEAWLCVGAGGPDLGVSSSFDNMHGLVWVGRQRVDGVVEWCGHDADAVAQLPAGLSIASIHDVDSFGGAIGIGRWLAGDHLPTLCILTDIADLNGDRLVNGADLAALLPAIGTSAGEWLDIDGDGEANAADLGCLLASPGWFSQAPKAVELSCDAADWVAPPRRYPHVIEAVEMLGFSDLDGFVAELRSLPTPQQAAVCEVVVVLAVALDSEGGVP